MSTGMARDLSGKLQSRLAEVLERELAIFQHALEPHEIGEVMLESAVMVARTTAATLAGYAKTPDEIERIFQSVTAAIVAMIQSGERDGIARAVAAVRKRAA